jgi:hypothetical protein
MTANEQSAVPDGPRSRFLAAEDQWPRVAKVEGSTVALFVDSRLERADMYGGINTVAPGAELPLHWHPIGELQYFLTGQGLLLDADGATSATTASDDRRQGSPNTTPAAHHRETGTRRGSEAARSRCCEIREHHRGPTG